uniref:Putative legume-like lectin n=1 Tax=Trypanosoma congolense (strain IL3000) TaxID=1068625 RepID=G0UX35_TRYCI|nr:putative legume-like lectin [Trypanosoma congolense IL3000]
MPPPSLRTTLLLLLLGSCAAEWVHGGPGTDYIQVHSVFPPILKNFWNNGMRFWSFGLNTIVTDNYIRLTDDRPNTSGYLWNRHANQMEAFELNVTLLLQHGNRVGSLDAGVSGIGIWYTTSDRFNRNETRFFGFQPTFSGVGIVMTNVGEISLVVNDGNTSMTANLLKEKRHGFCRVRLSGNKLLTLILQYTNSSLRVLYALHPVKEGTKDSFLRSSAPVVPCVTGPTLPLDKKCYFGVTATNLERSRVTHQVQSVVMTPLVDLERHTEEENMAAQPRLFREDENNLEDMSD